MSEQHNPEHGRPSGPMIQGIQHTPVGARVPEEIGRGVFSNATMILQSNDMFMVDFLSTMVQPQQVVARVVMTPATFAQLISALRENLALYETHFGKLACRESYTPPAPVVPPAPAAAPGPSSAAPAAPPAGEAGAAAPAHAAASGAAAGSTPGGAAAAGSTPESPRQPAPEQPRIEDLYDQLKLPDKMLGGAFANLVMIRHLAEEFSLDFIANFYPRPVVTSRVFLPAGRIPSFLEAMSNSFQMFRQKFSGGPPTTTTTGG